MMLIVKPIGIGQTILGQLEKQCPQHWYIRGILLMSGEAIEDINRVYHQPKREIINSLLEIPDSGQLKIPHDLPTKTDLMT